MGSREYVNNDYIYRMLAAVLIIYGNSKQEAMYSVYAVDASGQKLDAAQNRYTLRFAPDQFAAGQCVLVADDVRTAVRGCLLRIPSTATSSIRRCCRI